jgi:hypothetical protein
MNQRFVKPLGAKKQVLKAVELFGLSATDVQTHDDPQVLQTFIVSTAEEIKKEYGKNHFIGDRLSKMERKALGIELSKRQYNKRFRLLKRLEQKQHILTREGRKAEFNGVAKHGLAHQITFEEFSVDENTACFIAYYTARSNLRSEFTIFGQQSPYDEIADMLFDRLQGETSKGYLQKIVGQEKAYVTTTNW